MRPSTRVYHETANEPFPACGGTYLWEVMKEVRVRVKFRVRVGVRKEVMRLG